MKTSAVDYYLKLYEETEEEIYMYLAEKADIAYSFVTKAKEDEKRYMLIRCYNKLEEYVQTDDIDLIEEWIDRILTSQSTYDKIDKRGSYGQN